MQIRLDRKSNKYKVERFSSFYQCRIRWGIFVCEGAAFLVRQSGFEPETDGLENRYSIQLSYGYIQFLPLSLKQVWERYKQKYLLVLN